MTKKNNQSSTPNHTTSQSNHWYRHVASATLAAGASLVGTMQPASGEIIAYTSGETAGIGAGTSPFWQIQTLYFDFKTGNTYLSPILNTWTYEEGTTEGHGLPTTEMLPPGFPEAYQFGLAKVGPISALFSPAAQGEVAVNNQAMVRVVTGSYGGDTYQLLKPLKLGQSDVIGSDGNFLPKGPRMASTGLDMQTMAQAGDWVSSSPGYLGLKFSDDGENFHYGWAEVSVGAGGIQTLLRFGYNTDLNEPILAGQSDDADFDADGDVDGRDFLTWQRGFSNTGDATISEGDANQDGNVNEADLALWQDAYGKSVQLEPLADIAAVPEPSTTSLLVMGAAGLGMYRKIRQRRNDS